ncbi:MAG: aldehyde dehydrogenase family protein, partial [Solirubrobacterales bacterium]
EWVPAEGADPIEVIDPSSEEVIGAVPAGTADDVDRAVQAARSAFEPWAQTPLGERLTILERWHAELSERSDELADRITAEVGTPLAVSRGAQVGIALGILRAYLDVAREVPFEERIGHSLIAREPAGVAGCITPWNLPLIIIMQKLPAALIAGCPVVVKPSEVTPLHMITVAEAAAGAGLPPGVLNIVFGDGPSVGAAIAAHPDVDVVSFTGSTRAGRSVAAVGAETVKRVHLELGGKSANLILDDADLEAAVRAGVDQAFFNGGQSCIVWSRMLVPRERQDEVAALAATNAEGYRVGPPRDEGTDLGPLVSDAAHLRVTGYVRKGISEGARLATGGPERPEGLERGYYVRPTVFADVDPEMTIAREEIFGPVLTVIPYGDTDEAVRIANDTMYGLHGAVWSGDPERALAVARRLRTGMVDVNGAPFNFAAPFGGYKQSGVGREIGIHGIEEFCEVKSIQLPNDDDDTTGVGAKSTV